ncbi:DUF1364 domain-containing protein [Oxalobacter aliiformigenes]|uniref:hypothetical protein n=1 Tax=Oxalobacter aliiformigenes TaxID=2946593 RepID=UPI0022AF3063|nr:hypothetical protein [Oxalobacter aliiformigenes]MCZ4064106.1 DUF1364 domain-containing protein [Oxalobacter aliiformigenes]WAV99483.1 DUF1364 domain-containing protein [Oxalobacter aliiformigenes]
MIYRNRKLLDLAKFAPCCFGCGCVNDGTVVAAHSNQLRDGKGKGIKAHDFRVAYLCHDCHAEIDQGCRLSKSERLETWEEAHRKTVEWWFLSGVIGVTK